MAYPAKNSAAWLTWALQFLLGLVAGGIVGGVIMMIIIRIMRIVVGFSMQGGVLITYVCGTALIGGALASYYGDRLWLGRSSRIISPNSLQRSSTSRVASMTSGGAGIALLAGALLKQCGFWP